MVIGIRSMSAVAAALALAGCAATGYPPTFGDPQAKLQYAWQLMQSDRPLPAQRLILEAIDSCTQSGNEVALAEAYCVYADFLAWGSESQGQHYATKGFLPINGASIAWDDRFNKAVEYYKSSTVTLEKAKKNLSLIHCYLGMAVTYREVDPPQPEKSCAAFQSGLAAYRRLMIEKPETKLSKPEGFDSYEEFLQFSMKQTGCEK
jgi:hypothetical protein